MDAVKQKYIEKGFTFLDGSYSTGAYFLFAQHPETGGRLGVRVMANPIGVGTPEGGTKPVILISMRFRLMPPTAQILKLEEGDTPQGFTAPDNWGSSFPEMKWSKSSESRRSFMMGIVLDRRPEEAWMVAYDLEKVGFFEQVESFLMARMPRKAWAASPDTFREYLKDVIGDVFAECKPPVPEPAHILLARVRSQIAALEQQELALKKKVDSGEVEPEPADLVTSVEHIVPDLVHFDDLQAALAKAAEPKAKQVGFNPIVHDGGLADPSEDID